MDCAICGAKRAGNVCHNCGYDASCDFVSNRTVSTVPKSDAAQRKFLYSYHETDRRKNNVNEKPPQPIKTVTQPQPEAPTAAENKKPENKSDSPKLGNNTMITIFAVAVLIFAVFAIAEMFFGLTYEIYYITLIATVLIAIFAVVVIVRCVRRRSDDEQKLDRKDRLITAFAVFALLLAACLLIAYSLDNPWDREPFAYAALAIAPLTAIFAVIILQIVLERNSQGNEQKTMITVFSVAALIFAIYEIVLAFSLRTYIITLIAAVLIAIFAVVVIVRCVRRRSDEEEPKSKNPLITVFAVIVLIFALYLIVVHLGVISGTDDFELYIWGWSGNYHFITFASALLIAAFAFAVMIHTFVHKPNGSGNEQKAENARKLVTTIFAVIALIFAFHVMDLFGDSSTFRDFYDDYSTFCIMTFATGALSTMLGVVVICITHTPKNNATQKKAFNEKTLITVFAAVVQLFAVCALGTYNWWWGLFMENLLIFASVLIAMFASVIIIYNTYTTVRQRAKQRESSV